METECQHNYQFMESVCKRVYDSGYNTKYIRIDRFYCSKCLEQKEIKKEKYAREEPEWFINSNAPVV